ncbi:MAG: HAD-superfamily subfamily hydrolase [Caulobacter sp.]|nr:HAD-superfamily subfamily hydrolase [Caulobacter sp.]
MPMMGEPLDNQLLVAFDFDGTITTRDSFTAFLKWRAGSVRYAWGCLRLAPAAVSYVFHRNRGKLKSAAVREFLRGASADKLDAEARTFAETHAVMLFRPDALATWRRWRAKGARTLIVSASPDFVVAPFARGLGADVLIATKLNVDEAGRVGTGFDGLNCRGQEKVRRLQEVFGPDVHLTAAYGDTSGDREMLSIADEKGYRVFRGKP